MRTIIIFITFSLWHCNSTAQDIYSDSLERIIKLHEKDTSGILASSALCDHYLKTGEQQRAYVIARNSLDISNHLDYLRGKILSNLSLAKACQFLSRFDEGLKYSGQAISLSKNTGFKKSYATALTLSGVINVKKSSYDKAMDLLLMSLKINEELRDTAGMVNARSHVGILYGKLGEYDKALKEYRICEVLALKANYEHGLGNTYINISNAFAVNKKIDSSNVYLFKALELFRKANNKNNIAIVYGNLSLNYTDLGEYERAIGYLKECLFIEKQTGNMDGVVNTYLSFTDLYHRMKDFDTARIYADSCLALARKLNLRSSERDIQFLLYRNNKAIGDHKQALMNYEDYVNINNELVNEEGKRDIQRKQMEFEFEKKETILNAERENEKRKQMFIIYSISAGLLMVLIILLVIVRSLRINKAKNRIISEQKTIVEDKQREILDSIQYAKRIQISLLASEKYIQRSLQKLKSKKSDND